MTLGFKVFNSLSPSSDSKEYSIPSYKYTRKDDGWIFLPDLGRGAGCMGAKDVMAENSGATLEYEIDIVQNGKIAIGILPTQDIYPERGLRIGVQIDNQTVQVIDARQGFNDIFQEYTPQNIARSKVLKPLPPPNRLLLSGYINGRRLPRRDEVFDNMRWLEVGFDGISAGKHTLKIIMIDPEIVVEQIVVNPDDTRYSYFGKGGL